MKRRPARDITITLIIKFSLLFLLWYLCFNGVQKSTVTPAEWLLGPAHKTTVISKGDS